MRVTEKKAYATHKEMHQKELYKTDKFPRRCSVCEPGKGCNTRPKAKHGARKPKYKDHR